ncbi:MAG TPA: acetyltransferase [Cyclobacteriaceae bacterium]|nr:acetyltransferase [Cyclobacteriaceae bacterium]
MIFYGAGGHAKVVIEAWIASGSKVTAIYDDNVLIKDIMGRTVSGRYQPEAFPGADIVISIGSNNIRRDVSRIVKNRFGLVKHPSAIISTSAQIGEGTVVMAGTLVQAESVLGKHVILNTRASVDHDCNVGDYVHIAPGVILCGEVSIGEGALIGAGATLLPGVSVGKWAIVGAGSVVTTDVPDFAVVVGIPSKARTSNSPPTNPGI